MISRDKDKPEYIWDAGVDASQVKHLLVDEYMRGYKDGYKHALGDVREDMRDRRNRDLDSTLEMMLGRSWLYYAMDEARHKRWKWLQQLIEDSQASI